MKISLATDFQPTAELKHTGREADASLPVHHTQSKLDIKAVS
jgi:hypothetical protein